jgi:hypothetical protein
MYQYENGVKRKNVGYARIEAKNGQCKITLHMQLLGQLDSIFPTYLIQRDNNTMELVYLGDSVLKNQVMDSKLLAEETNIMGSGFRLSDMGGLLLFLNEKIFFATEWDDKPIIAKEVLHALRPKPKNNIPHKISKEFIEETKYSEDTSIEENTLAMADDITRIEEDILTEVDEAELLEPEAEIVGAKVADTKVAEVMFAEETLVKEAQETIATEDETSIPKYKLPRGWKTIERLQNSTNHVETMKFTKITDLKAVEEDSKDFVSKDVETVSNETAETSTNEVIETISNKEIEAKESTGFEGIEQEIGQEEELSETSSYGYEDAMDNSENEIAGTEFEEDIPDPITAQHFFENYPRIYPFEDNEVILCVKIEPKDIGLLPKETWSLSNNSFLMHGFYCYHHLIFAKLKNRYGCYYVIGIPGIYHSRERFMARMFGFEEFKSIRKRELKQGDFGYWYLPVNL